MSLLQEACPSDQCHLILVPAVDSLIYRMVFAKGLLAGGAPVGGGETVSGTELVSFSTCTSGNKTPNFI